MFVDYILLQEGISSPRLTVSRSAPLLLYYSPTNRVNSKLAEVSSRQNSSHINLKIQSEDLAFLYVTLYYNRSPPVPGSQLLPATEHFQMQTSANIHLYRCKNNCEFFIILKLMSPNLSEMQTNNGEKTKNVSVLIENVDTHEYHIWVKICLVTCLFLPMYLVFFIIYTFEKCIHTQNSNFTFLFFTPVFSKEKSSLLSSWEKEEFSIKKKKYEVITIEVSLDIETTHKDCEEPRRVYLQKKYMRFVWGICCIGLFFGIPAFQSSLLKQKLAEEKGDLDFCYYNMKCAQRMGTIDAFNNVWSNSGFVFLGVLFILIVLVRHVTNTAEVDRGVSRYLGLELAMGLSMIVEGAMSALYHLCPNAGNYQYDTLFMLVSLLLITLQLYTNRHGQSNLSSHTFILLIAAFACLSLLEAFESAQSFYLIRSVYILFILLTTLLIIANLYYLGNISLVVFTVFDVITRRQTICRVFWPQNNKHRVVHLFFVLVINFIGGCCFLSARQMDISSIFIGIFIGNFLFYLSYYWMMKIIKREYRYNTLVFAITFVIGILSLILWIIAISFYFSPVSNWALGPVASKEMNRDCILWGFYDSHDLWHILSAYALFFTYLSIVKTDDNVASIRQELLNVF